MRLTLDVDDDLYESLVKQVGKEKVTAEVKRRVNVLEGIAKDDRVVILHGEDRRQLEKLFQTTVETPQQIVREFNNLSQLKIGTIERGFTPGELVRLKTQADFHGWPPAKFLELTSNEALDYIMGRI